MTAHNMKNFVSIAYSNEEMIILPILITSRIMYIFNPLTPKSDQFQISPAASPQILHHTVWRTWPSVALVSCMVIILPILTTSYISLKVREIVLFELGSKRVNNLEECTC